jgi:SulP family sulfate permease
VNLSSNSKSPFLVAVRNFYPTVFLGSIIALDNLTWIMAIATLLFSGPLLSGLGLGFGTILFSAAILSLVVSLTSGQRNSIAYISYTTIPIIAFALMSMAKRMGDAHADVKVITAIAVIGLSTVVTGAVLWLVGQLRLGYLVRFLPHAVVTGFLAGTGYLLIEGGLATVVGDYHGLELFRQLAHPAALGVLVPALALAVLSVFLLRRFPHPVVAPVILVVATLIFYGVIYSLGISNKQAQSFGWLPDVSAIGNVSLPGLGSFSLISWNQIWLSAPVLISIPLFATIGVLLNTSAMELALGEDLDADVELKSSGIANFFAGLAGGPFGYTFIPATVLADKFGVKGMSAGIAPAVGLAIAFPFAQLVLSSTPIFINAGLVLYFGLEVLIEWVFLSRKKMSAPEWACVLLILLVVAAVGLLEGLVVGLAVSILVFIINYSRLPVIRFSASGDAMHSLVDRAPESMRRLNQQGSSIEIVYLQGYLFFGTAQKIMVHVRSRLEDAREKPLRFLILDFTHVSDIDSSAAASFAKIHKKMQQNDVQVFFCQLAYDVRLRLEQGGLNFDERTLHADFDVDHALELCEEVILADKNEVVKEFTLEQHIENVIGKHPRCQDLAKAMEMLHYPQGSYLMRSTDENMDVFIVAKGRVSVKIVLENGRTLRLSSMTDGAIVGEVSHYLKQKRSADVIVDRPSVIYRMASTTLDRLAKFDKELLLLFHQLIATSLAEKLVATNRSVGLTRLKRY